MYSVQKRVIAIVLIFALTISAFLQTNVLAYASEIVTLGSEINNMDLIITEAYIDDISRPEWVPLGASVFDPMEYVEIYNTTDSPINFSQDFSLLYYRKTANKEFSLPLYDQTEDVIIPAHGSIVLWGFLASRYATASTGEIPSIDDFRSAFQIDDSIGIYKVDTTSSTGFYNTYNGSFRIKNTVGNIVCEAAFTPETDSADGKSIEFQMPPEGNTMLIYGQMSDPTPGVVAQEQYTLPEVPDEPNKVDLIITEAYIDDISRPEWVPSGASVFDPMEYVEIYNTTDSPINFSQNFSLHHYRNSANKEYSLPLYNQTEDVIIPANSSIVLWGFLASRYTAASAEEIPTVDNFRSAFQIDDSVKVYMVNTTSCVGFYNTYDGSFRIKDTGGNIVCEAAFTPATDSADGKSIEFRIPPEGNKMLLYGQMSDPTPGVVAEEQYTPPELPKEPVISNIVAKDNYTNEDPFTVSASITEAKSASIYIKQSDVTGYQRINMENHGNGTFSVSVGRSKLWGDDLKWYIEAYNETKQTKSEEKISHIEYSYDSTKQPQVLMTELKTEDTDYNYLEYYNNSDHVINFVYYNIFYEYPSGLSYKYWTFDTNALYVAPGDTLVVWINDDDKTVAQFNQHYGVNLEENKSIIKVDYSGMSPDVERTIKFGNTYDDITVLATYHEDEFDDTAKVASIHYTYSRDNTNRMVKGDIAGGPTPGAVEAWQVPPERVPFDNYGNNDDGDTMVLSPREGVPETINEGESLNVAFDCYDTSTGVNTIETYYKFDNEEQYRVMMDKRQRIPNQFITSIPASEFLGHKKVTFFIRAYNAFRYYDTEIYEVSIKPSIDEDGITLNVDDNQIVSGEVSIAAVTASGSSDIKIQIDNQEQPVFPVMEGGAYFSYKADNLTSYYKNAVTVGEDVIKLLSSWANVNQQAAHLDSSNFTKKDNGDYEVTVTIRAGSQGSPFEETGEHVSFIMGNMALYLPNGTYIYPDNGITYDNQYTIGDSAMSLDVHFTIHKEEISARGTVLDTTKLTDGEHLVKASVDSSVKNVIIMVDNKYPEVDLGIQQGQILESGYIISPLVGDEASGIDDSKTDVNLDGARISLPYKISNLNVKNGVNTLSASYTDYAGHTTQKSVDFSINITSPSSIVGEVEHTNSSSAELSIKIDGDQDKDYTVDFMEGKQFSIGQNNIKVSSWAGDNPLADEGLNSLSYSSNKDFPYQLFEIETGNLADEDIIEADWKGNGNTAPKMLVLNVKDNKWETVAAVEQDRIKASFKAKDHVKEGKVQLLVQSRSEGSYPSTADVAVDHNTADNENDDSSDWDGTGVPENYDFSFAWITDPQYYVESWPDHYVNMNQWILDNRDKYNIKYTVNTGDLIDEWDREEQWKIADDAQRLLDDANMPNGVLAGNHDVASGNEEYDSYWKYFGEERYNGNSYYGGSYRNNLGHYDLISAGGQDFIILYMSWDTYYPEVEWMNEVLAKYPERKAIIAMHRYLTQNATLDYSGELVQKEVVANNPNVFAVIDGHYFGAAIKVDGFDDDHDGIKERKVYQICTDYQGAVEGGLQYLKMIYFDLDNNKVYMNSYSPYLDDFNYFDNPKLDSYDIGVAASSQDIYELDEQFDTSLKTLQTTDMKVDVYTDNSIGKYENASGQVAQIWDDLAPETNYWWYGTITNDKGDIFRTSLIGFHTLNLDSDEPITVPKAPTEVVATAGNKEATVSFTIPSDDGGSPITEYVVISNPGGIMATGIATANQVTGSAITTTRTAITVTGLTNGNTYTFTVRAVNAVGSSEESVPSNAVTPRAPSKGSSNTTTKPEKTDELDTEILIDGKSENLATAVTSVTNNKIVTTITLDDKKVEERLKEGNNALITIPFNNNLDIAVGQFSGLTAKNMENAKATIQIKTEDVTYTIPAEQININNVLSKLGSQGNLEDLLISISISPSSKKAVKMAADKANINNYQIVIEPIDFEITCTLGNKTVVVDNFSRYVERLIAIPENIDPNDVTTAIVLNPDGTFSHVPTAITYIDGKYYAKINSLTNSTYSVIWNPKTFDDVENHWAKESVNEMGSRLIIDGVGNGKFEPDRNITRAEFAAILVRALGLMRPGTGKDAFPDVTKDAWYYDAVSIADEHGLISGYENGKFGPSDQITREQAMVMIARAMEITELDVKLKSGELEKLLADFGDWSQSAKWAEKSIASCVKSGIVSGKNDKTLAPKDEITRAEVAEIIRRLLQKSKLI